MEPWEGIVEIPEGSIGPYSIEHFKRPAGKVALSHLRSAIIGGQGMREPLVFARETNWHRLSGPTGVWMTDLPIEQLQHDELLEPVSGRILIGGLGLGYAVNSLCLNPRVSEIVVVEISKDVVDLVEPHLKKNGIPVTVVMDDLHDYLKDPNGSFDWAFFDIWQSDREETFFHTVIPLLESGRHLIPCGDRNILCWNEDVMRGQLFNGLLSRFMMINARKINKLAESRGAEKVPTMDIDFLCEERVGEGSEFFNWMVEFWKLVRQGVIDNANITPMARTYSNTWGRGIFGQFRKLVELESIARGIQLSE